MAKLKKTKPPPVPKAPAWAISLADRLAELIERLNRIEGEVVRHCNIENLNGKELAELKDEMHVRHNFLVGKLDELRESREWRGHMVLQEIVAR